MKFFKMSIFIILGVILVAAVAGFYFLSMKKKKISANPNMESKPQASEMPDESMAQDVMGQSENQSQDNVSGTSSSASSEEERQV